MGKSNRSELPPEPQHDERRHFPRKKVLLCGVITELNGDHPTDCTIRDLTKGGARVQLARKFEPAKQLYLIDTRIEVAHLTNVQWSSGGHTGLSFVESCSFELVVPETLDFLDRHCLAAKVRQIGALMRRGITKEEAIEIVGVTEQYLDRLTKRSRPDERLMIQQVKRLFIERSA